jgi:hypothetical protein
MSLDKLLEGVCQLRELVMSGADTQVVLEFIDRFQLHLPRTD